MGSKEKKHKKEKRRKEKKEKDKKRRRRDSSSDSSSGGSSSDEEEYKRRKAAKLVGAGCCWVLLMRCAKQPGVAPSRNCLSYQSFCLPQPHAAGRCWPLRCAVLCWECCPAASLAPLALPALHSLRLPLGDRPTAVVEQCPMLPSRQGGAFRALQAKKVAQHLKKHKVTGVGYTNDDNPFGGCCSMASSLMQLFQPAAAAAWSSPVLQQLFQPAAVALPARRCSILSPCCCCTLSPLLGMQSALSGPTQPSSHYPLWLLPYSGCLAC